MKEAGSYLLPLTGQVKRRPHAVLDIETKAEDGTSMGMVRPFMAGFYDGETYAQFVGWDCLDQLLRHLLVRKYAGWSIYAHNGGGFDFLHLLPHLKKLQLGVEVSTVGSGIQLMTVNRARQDQSRKSGKKKGLTWRFVDSIRLLPMSLKKAAKTFGASTQKGEMDLSAPTDDPRWGEYLRADCVSLWQTMDRFHDTVECVLGGEVGITAASTAMKTYRRSYQPRAIERHTEHHAFVREAYFGGRVEVFARHAKGLHYYDVNSSYPASMCEPLPVGDCVRWTGKVPKSVMQGRVGFCRARVDYPPTLFPALPVRSGGKLIFPVGRLEGTWTWIELEAAMEDGAKVEILESLWFSASPVLLPFVQALYPLRDKSRPDYDEGLSATAKLLMNSLYGKWAQKQQRERLVIMQPGDPLPEGEPLDPLDPDCAVWRCKLESDASYIVPQIAAQITALSRLKLLRLLRASGPGTAYCDTDSVITTTDLSPLCSPELGSLKDEGEGRTYEGHFLAPKVYCLQSDDGEVKLAMKGYGREGRTVEAFSRLMLGGSLPSERLEKVGALYSVGFKRGPLMVSVAKQLRADGGDKRQFLPDGRSMPICLDMTGAVMGTSGLPRHHSPGEGTTGETQHDEEEHPHAVRLPLHLPQD